MYSNILSFYRSNTPQQDEGPILNNYSKGQNIFVQGSLVNGPFRIVHGIVKTTKLDMEGNEVIIKINKQDDFIGLEASNPEQKTFITTATSITDCSLQGYDQKDFLQTISLDANLFKQYHKSLLQTHLEDIKYRSDLSYLSVAQKVIKLLAYLSDKFGTVQGNRSFIPGLLKREEMASFIGITSESLIRELSFLKKSKLINTQGKSITINQTLQTWPSK